jgi:phosphomevalonate kinase
VEGLSQTLAATNPAWTQKTLPLRLPPHTRLLLADVAVGSDTPSLVGNVLKWRQANPKVANDLWTSLDEDNQEFGRTLSSLSAQWEESGTTYDQVANYLSSIQQIQVSGLSPDAALPRIFRALKSITVGSKPGLARGGESAYRWFCQVASRIRGSPCSPRGIRSFH